MEAGGYAMWRFIFVVTALLSAGAAQAQARQPATPEEQRSAEEALAVFTSPSLTLFGSDEEFRRYIGAARAAARARGDLWASFTGIQYAHAQLPGEVQSDVIEPICPESDPACAAIPGGDSIILTGSRINVSNPSITNNQMRGVEEGDIVKQIGGFLLVLQDGRLFVIDTRARGGRGLALVDRIDVYRDPDTDTWYDEMLVLNDRILVAGYSYDESATELSIFRLSDSGRLDREGVFYISSGDYYSTSNYATRLIGDDLVIYTPLELLGMNRAGFRWPVVRRWQPDSRRWAVSGDRPLFDATQIYRPVRDTSRPVVHSVSVCPLGSMEEGRDLACRTTAFVGPERVNWYVTDRHVYLWTAPRRPWARIDCAPDQAFALADMTPALLYRVPILGAQPDLVATSGFPPDQFAMQADAQGFHALAVMDPSVCDEDHDAPTRLSFFSIPEQQFGATLSGAPDTAFTTLPAVRSRWIASRFTDTHLVYGGLSSRRRGFPDLSDYDEDDDYVRRATEEMRPQPAYVLPVSRPDSVRTLDVGHTVIRAERVAGDIVLTGYRDRSGLTVSMIKLDGRPRIASSILLPERFESEGRSHAFNSLAERYGGGLAGLPTVRRLEGGARWWWRSQASDLSFLAFDSDGRLERLGELVSRVDYDEEEDGIPGYECEVSCIDWYGNSRPIFTDGRIFALTGTELVEGRIVNGRIREARRLNIAVPAP